MMDCRCTCFFLWGLIFFCIEAYGVNETPLSVVLSSEKSKTVFQGIVINATEVQCGDDCFVDFIFSDDEKAEISTDFTREEDQLWKFIVMAVKTNKVKVTCRVKKEDFSCVHWVDIIKPELNRFRYFFAEYWASFDGGAKNSVLRIEQCVVSSLWHYIDGVEFGERLRSETYAHWIGAPAFVLEQSEDQNDRNYHCLPGGLNLHQDFDESKFVAYLRDDKNIGFDFFGGNMAVPGSETVGYSARAVSPGGNIIIKRRRNSSLQDESSVKRIKLSSDREEVNRVLKLLIPGNKVMCNKIVKFCKSCSLLSDHFKFVPNESLFSKVTEKLESPQDLVKCLPGKWSGLFLTLQYELFEARERLYRKGMPEIKRNEGGGLSFQEKKEMAVVRSAASVKEKLREQWEKIWSECEKNNPSNLLIAPYLKHSLSRAWAGVSVQNPKQRDLFRWMVIYQNIIYEDYEKMPLLLCPVEWISRVDDLPDKLVSFKVNLERNGVCSEVAKKAEDLYDMLCSDKCKT